MDIQRQPKPTEQCFAAKFPIRRQGTSRGKFSNLKYKSRCFILLNIFNSTLYRKITRSRVVRFCLYGVISRLS